MATLLLRIIGAIWYVLFFGFVLPITMLLVSLALDEQLRLYWDIGLEWSTWLLMAAALLAVASFVLIVLSVVTLHHEGKAYPWAFGSHAAYNPQRLVTSGAYALVRNPMATSYLLFLLALGCAVPSLVMIVWMVPLSAGLLYEYFEFTEEKRLVEWFGKEYIDYRKRTPSLLPRVDALWKNFGKRI